MLVDSHCHLDFPDFAPELEAVVARAGAAGVGFMLTIGTKLSKFPQVLAVAEKFANVCCTVGVHPHEAATETELSKARLLDLAQHPRVIGFGETGLDYYYQHSPREMQQAAFRIHIEAAREAGLPVVIHTRDADGDMARMLDEEMAKGPFTGLLHCFTSGRALAEKAVSHGIYVSFSGILTFKGADAIRETAQALPSDKLLIETDAPYLAPVPMRGKRNEPAFVAHTSRFLANLRGLEEDEFARVTTENFFRLFKKAKRPA